METIRGATTAEVVEGSWSVPRFILTFSISYSFLVRIAVAASVDDDGGKRVSVSLRKLFEIDCGGELMPSLLTPSVFCGSGCYPLPSGPYDHYKGI